MSVTVTNAVTTPDWTATATAGSASSSEATDDDLGVCREFVSTQASTLEAKLTNGGTRVACRQRQVIFVRGSLKATAGAGALGLILYFYNSAGALASTSTALNQTNPVTVGEVYELEGFHTVPDGAESVWVSYYFISSTAPTMRVARPQVSVDPWGDVPAYTASASEVVPASLPAIYGPNDNPFQWANPELTYERQLQIARACGANTVRFALTFDSGSGFPGEYPQQTQGGAIDWHATHWGDYLDAIRAAGLRALPIAFQTPLWMDSELSIKNLAPGDYAAFAQVYAALCEEWQDTIAGIELHNEPNLGFFWNFNSATTTDDPDAAKYTDLLKVFYPAIKEAAPDVKVIAGALSHRQTSTDHNKSLADFLDVMVSEGYEDYADAISVHPYASSNRSGNISPVGDWGAGVWGAINQVRARTTLPIWATEFGYPAATYEDERWAAITNALTRGMLDRQPDVEATFVHTFVREYDGSALSEPYAIVRLPAEAYLGSAQTLSVQ